MEITKEQIQSRLDTLVKERDILQSKIIQGQADLNVYNGAIIECQYWLENLDKEKPTEEIKE
jgi:hypothetical protein